MPSWYDVDMNEELHYAELADWDWNAHMHRRETGLLEFTCPHGVGHPNLGSAVWVAEAYDHPTDEENNPWLIHGCDGCCGHPSYPTLIDSLVWSHGAIREQNATIERWKSLVEDFMDELYGDIS